MTDEWYFKALGEVFGPVSFDIILQQCRNEQLTRDDLVRQGADREWVEAGSISGLYADSELDDPGEASESSDGDGLEEFQDISEFSFEATRPAEPAVETEEAESTGEAAWYARVLGMELGPMPLDDLKTMAEHRQLSVDDEVRFRAEGEWKTAQSIDNLFPAAVDPEELPHVSPAAETAGAAVSAAAESRETSEVTQPESQDAGSPEIDDGWYMRIDDVEYGPIDLDELKRLIGRGRISAEDNVKQGESGKWVRAGSVALSSGDVADAGTARAVSGRAARGGATPAADFGSPDADGPSPTKSAGTVLPVTPSKFRAAEYRPAAKRPSGALDWTSWLEQVPDNAKWAGFLVVALIVLVMLFVPFGGSDQEYYDLLIIIWDEHKQMRERMATDQEWQEFGHRIEQQLKPIIRELSQTAEEEQPIKQHLLWAGRDYLPMMVINAREKPSEYEELFAEHMEHARLMMVGQPSAGQDRFD